MSDDRMKEVWLQAFGFALLRAMDLAKVRNLAIRLEDLASSNEVVRVDVQNGVVTFCRKPAMPEDFPPTFTGAGDTRVPEGEPREPELPRMDGEEMMPFDPEDSDA